MDFKLVLSKLLPAFQAQLIRYGLTGGFAMGLWGEKPGWSEEKTYTLQAGKERIPLSVIDILFGLESGNGDKAHVRGALSFWDVIPQSKGDSLMVEIMTPH